MFQVEELISISNIMPEFYICYRLPAIILDMYIEKNNIYSLQLPKAFLKHATTHLKIFTSLPQNNSSYYNFSLSMEENLKVIDLNGLSNNQYIDQFRNLIANREVDKITFFISYKPKKQGLKTKMDRNIQQKTTDAINVLKEKKRQEQTLSGLKINFKASSKQQENLLEGIPTLYELGEYQKVISIIKDRQVKLNQKQNSLSQARINQESNNIQYNFLSFTLGNCYFRLKKHDLAITQYQKFTDHESARQRAQRMNNLGTCFAIKNSYQQALKAYNEAVKYYSECREEDVSSLLNNIAMIYLKCEMYKTAQQYFIESINQRKAKTPNNKAMLYNSYFNLGICQKKIKKLQESLNNLLIALNYAYDGFGKKVDVINQVCQVYQEQQKWSQALSFYEKLSEQYEIISKPQGSIYQRVSKIHEGRGNSIMAAKYAKKAFKLYYQQGNQRKMSELSGSPLVNMPNSL